MDLNSSSFSHSMVRVQVDQGSTGRRSTVDEASRIHAARAVPFEQSPGYQRAGEPGPQLAVIKREQEATANSGDGIERSSASNIGSNPKALNRDPRRKTNSIVRTAGTSSYHTKSQPTKNELSPYQNVYSRAPKLGGTRNHGGRPTRTQE